MGWVRQNTTLFLFYLLGWQHVSATVGHLQVIKMYNEEKIYSIRTLVVVPFLSFHRDLVESSELAQQRNKYTRHCNRKRNYNQNNRYIQLNNRNYNNNISTIHITNTNCSHEYYQPIGTATTHKIMNKPIRNKKLIYNCKRRPSRLAITINSQKLMKLWITPGNLLSGTNCLTISQLFSIL